MFYFAVCCTRCPCHCLHAWVVSHRLWGYLPCVFMRLALVCFYCLCVFVYVFYFIATMSFAGYFSSVLFCLLSMLISDSRFDLVWFRLSCDHGWIRSGSVNVRKQQQKTTAAIMTVLSTNHVGSRSFSSRGCAFRRTHTSTDPIWLLGIRLALPLSLSLPSGFAPSARLMVGGTPCALRLVGDFSCDSSIVLRSIV